MSTAPPAQRVASLQWMLWPAVAFVAVMVLFPFGYAFWLSLLDSKIGQSDAFIGAGNYKAIISLAVDAFMAEGNAFVTEYAGPSNVISNGNLWQQSWNASSASLSVIGT